MIANLHAMMQQLALAQPAAPALLSPGRDPMCCHQLLELACRRGQELPAFGIAPGDALAIALPQGPEAAAACLTLGSFVPVAPWNIDHPEAAWRGFLAAVKPKGLVALAGLDTPPRRAAVALGLAVIEIQWSPCQPAGWFELLPKPSAPPCGTRPSLSPSGADDVALLLSTSGSTGEPKIVALTHQAICLSAWKTATLLELAPTDRCLNMLPQVNVHSLVTSLTAPLIAGGSVVVAPGFEAVKFLDWLADSKPTWYSVAPLVHRQILELLPASRSPWPSRLRFIRSGSAPLPKGLLEAIESALGVPVIEAYGMTEVPSIAGNPVGLRKVGSVGKPVVQELAIVDEHGNRLPSYCSGEVAVRGPTVMRGYWHDPTTTESAWKDGWFRTGDLGRLDKDGYLYLVGRLKEIINRGGNKVLPRAVEDCLMQCVGVIQAVVFPVPHASLGHDVAAAVVPKHGATLALQELRRQLLLRLPATQVPSQIIIVPRIPVLPSGKISRLQLAESFAAELTPAHEPPQTANECLVAGIFAEVLSLPRIGRTDNFFTCGGDSLSGMRAMARLSEAFHLDLPVHLLFAAPSAAELVLKIERRLATDVRLKPACIERLARQDCAL